VLHTFKHFGSKGMTITGGKELLVVLKALRIAHSLMVTESRRMWLAEDWHVWERWKIRIL